MSGTGARSVSKHGIVVYLDKEPPLPQPSCRVPPAPIPAQEGAPNAATTRPDGVPGTSRQRRSRCRLQERLERRAAAQVQERSTQLRGGGNGPAAEAAAEATGGRAVAEAQLPPNPAATSPSARLRPAVRGACDAAGAERSAGIPVYWMSVGGGASVGGGGRAALTEADLDRDQSSYSSRCRQPTTTATLSQAAA